MPHPWPTVFTTMSPAALVTLTVDEAPLPLAGPPLAELKARTGVVWCTPVKSSAPLWMLDCVAPESVTTTLLVPVAGATSCHRPDRGGPGPPGGPRIVG